MDVLVDLAVEVKLVLFEVLHALLKSSLGQSMFRLACSCVEPMLLLTYVLLKYLIGPITTRLPRSTKFAIRSSMILLSHILNVPMISTSLRELMCVLVIEAVKVRYGQEAQEEIAVFLWLGEGKQYLQQATKWGSGKRGDFRNRYFPDSLAQGPSSKSNRFCVDNDEAAKLTNLRIAESLLLMSIICYRDDSVIRECMKKGMFPSLRYYSVHTLSDTDLSIFVAKEWAVFAFRGTEFETMRDILTSAIVEETIHFTGRGRVRRRYYQSMRTACGESRVRRYEVEPPIGLPGRLNATVFDLVKLLNSDGVKIYTTGHSLGGGLATLFGAHIRLEFNVTPAAVVTFGSPPVAGNEAFIRWFRASIPCNWRFVFGKEFGPLSPPLPFTSTARLMHVDGLVDVQNLRCADTQQLSYDEQIVYLDQLARTMDLSSLFYDHNPVLTLRVLHMEAVRAKHSVSMELED